MKFYTQVVIQFCGVKACIQIYHFQARRCLSLDSESFLVRFYAAANYIYLHTKYAKFWMELLVLFNGYGCKALQLSSKQLYKFNVSFKKYVEVSSITTVGNLLINYSSSKISSFSHISIKHKLTLSFYFYIYYFYS